jgi:hypothetical protein
MRRKATRWSRIAVALAIVGCQSSEQPPPSAEVINGGAYELKAVATFSETPADVLVEDSQGRLVVGTVSEPRRSLWEREPGADSWTPVAVPSFVPASLSRTNGGRALIGLHPTGGSTVGTPSAWAELGTTGPEIVLEAPATDGGIFDAPDQDSDGGYIEVVSHGFGTRVRRRASLQVPWADFGKEITPLLAAQVWLTPGGRLIACGAASNDFGETHHLFELRPEAGQRVELPGDLRPCESPVAGADGRPVLIKVVGDRVCTLAISGAGDCWKRGETTASPLARGPFPPVAGTGTSSYQDLQAVLDAHHTLWVLANRPSGESDLLAIDLKGAPGDWQLVRANAGWQAIALGSDGHVLVLGAWDEAEKRQTISRWAPRAP